MMSGAMDSVDPCPAEDAINVLLEYLVDPKSPSKSAARSIPSQSVQESVAKQVHAVVLLYNYYHRKQHTDLKFFGFEDFCKSAVISRPALLNHLNLMQVSNDTELNLEKQLSLMEKTIMDACDISTSLYASKNAPIAEQWTISKVAIFLVDSLKEHCLLQYGSITEGVWSVIEKDVVLCVDISKGNMDSKPATKKTRYIRKPVKNVPGNVELGLQQHAFSAVKEVTGIDQGNLSVLEKHVVYSTSKEKAAVCFYIIQCTSNDNHVAEYPIKDVINRLQGPLFIKSSNQWMHTSVVEYFHLLPYAEVLSNWFSSFSAEFNMKVLPSLEVQKVESENKNVNFSKDIKEETFEVAFPKVSDRKQPGNKTFSGSAKQNEDDGYHVRENDGIHNMEVDDSFVINPPTEDKGTNTDIEVQPDNHKKSMTSVDEYLHSLTKKARIADSLKRQSITQNSPELTVSEIKTANTVSSHHDQVPHNAIVKYQRNSSDLNKVCNVIASKDRELSQAALRVIKSKRAKLCFQQREIEDQILQCDKNIQTIQKGGEGDLALKIECVLSVIEGCNDASLRSLIQGTTYQHGDDQCMRERKLLPLKPNSLQELDALCDRNDWILPTYRFSVIDGQIQANVTVKGTDFEFSSEGNLHSRPIEARESAAEKMMIKLQNVHNIIW